MAPHQFPLTRLYGSAGKAGQCKLGMSSLTMLPGAPEDLVGRGPQGPKLQVLNPTKLHALCRRIFHAVCLDKATQERQLL